MRIRQIEDLEAVEELIYRLLDRERDRDWLTDAEAMMETRMLKLINDLKVLHIDAAYYQQVLSKEEEGPKLRFRQRQMADLELKARGLIRPSRQREE